MTDAQPADSQRPAWARRIRAERDARRWSQTDAVRSLRGKSSQVLPPDSTLLRNWKRWEAGTSEPDDFYKPLIAKTFGTVTAALFPTPAGERNSALLAGSGMDTLELVSRVRSSDVSPATLDGLRITAERLCSEYSFMPSGQLLSEGQAWLRRITHLLDQRLTLNQHREILTLAGWVALLVGCVEYDMGRKQVAEGTRRAALSLGEEAGHSEIVGWAHEMRAWYSLTQGDYRGVIAASEAGQQAAPAHSVSVQLAAQKAKAWARMGDRRQVSAALDEGRALLESLPYPENLDNHFVVDPAKFDYYAMDCYRLLGEDRLAKAYANQVMEASTDFDGTDIAPMRNSEARVTLGVVAMREGDVEQSVAYGMRALDGERKSLPSLLMISRELAVPLRDLHADNAEVAAYLDRLRTLRAG